VKCGGFFTKRLKLTRTDHMGGTVGRPKSVGRWWKQSNVLKWRNLSKRSSETKQLVGDGAEGDPQFSVKGSSFKIVCVNGQKDKSTQETFAGDYATKRGRAGII